MNVCVQLEPSLLILAYAKLAKELGGLKPKDALIATRNTKFMMPRNKPAFVIPNTLTSVLEASARNARHLENGITAREDVTVPITWFGHLKPKIVNVYFQIKLT